MKEGGQGRRRRGEHTYSTYTHPLCIHVTRESRERERGI
ncbi:hypothetical protein E2C01_085775 [Portunus trituberculatus]|uniref:Uncharacterized protein n=1 Tax=Portunus trituberculatus TaxID=210409 RepID=A0A5B7J7R9_PORTR|nr:hypothetical protein [Portunus trituberculatus]